MHPAQLSAEELLAECQQRTDRRSGPGGQHRNKVETAVILTHRPTGISSEANERRSQVDNRRNALFRLRLALATGIRSQDLGLQLPPQPSDLWQSRSSGSRLTCSAKHEDFPAILSELLDHLADCDFELTRTAEFFGTTTSQLIKLLRSHSPALQAINEVRAKKGLHKLS